MNANRTSSSSRAAVFLALAVAAGLPVRAAAAPPSSAPHLLRLDGDDRLAGAVTSFGEGDLLWFSHPSATGPIAFRLAAVRGIEAATPPADPEAGPATLTFNNGDCLPADVLSLAGPSLTISSAVAARKFTIAWDTVAGIRFNDDAITRVFYGPFHTQNWLIFDKTPDGAKPGKEPGQRSWRMENNEISGNGSGCAAVDAGLPDKATIEWEMHWTGMLNCSIGFFCDSFAPVDPADPGGSKVWQEMRQEGQTYLHKEGLSLDINPHSVMVQIYTADNGQDMAGSAQMPAMLRARSSANFKVAVNRQLGTLSLWVDGKLVQAWSDLGVLSAKGKAISVWQQHDQGTLRLGKLQVTTWDGKSNDEAPSPEKDKDVLISTDGSRLSGLLGEFDGASWSIAGVAGDIRVKRDDIRHVLRPAAKTIASPPESACARLPGGYALHLSSPKLSPGGQLQGHHPVLGDVSLPFASLESLEFPAAPAHP